MLKKNIIMIKFKLLKHSKIKFQDIFIDEMISSFLKFNNKNAFTNSFKILSANYSQKSNNLLLFNPNNI